MLSYSFLDHRKIYDIFTRFCESLRMQNEIKLRGEVGIDKIIPLSNGV